MHGILYDMPRVRKKIGLYLECFSQCPHRRKLIFMIGDFSYQKNINTHTITLEGCPQFAIYTYFFFKVLLVFQ